jgi:hypothetical protein
MIVVIAALGKSDACTGEMMCYSGDGLVVLGFWVGKHGFVGPKVLKDCLVGV